MNIVNIIVDVVWIVIAILYTIAYFTFAIWNVFVTKKQIVMSVIDLVYFCIAGGIVSYIGECHSLKFALIFFSALVLWSIILSIALEKNKKRKESGNM